MSWFDDRAGHITASRVHRLMSNRLSTVTNFISELQSELDFGATTTFSNAACERGKELEPVAVESYYAYTGLKPRADFEMFVKHPEIKFVGCSPDGVIMQGESIIGGVEVKCPTKIANHTKHFERGPSRMYYFQVMHTLFVTGAAFWDFCSFHPDLKANRIHIERFTPDADVFAALDERLKWASEFLKNDALPSESEFKALEGSYLKSFSRGTLGITEPLFVESEQTSCEFTSQEVQVA